MPLNGNTTGNANTATGVSALSTNRSGSANTATGELALVSNTTDGNNIAVSYLAGAHRNTGDNNIDIGHQGIAGEVKTIRSGTQGTQVRTFIAGISDTALRAGVLVRVDVAGQLGPVPSLARFKQNIKLTDKASEAVLALKPVIFRHKHAYDPESIAQFGLVVEDVEKVADKSRPPQTHSGMSRRREQKHLIHNWSDCRCRDRAQTPRAVLRVGVASGSQRLIPTGGRIGLRSYR